MCLEMEIWSFQKKFTCISTILMEDSKKIFEQLLRKIAFDCLNFHQSLLSLGVMQTQLANDLSKFYTCHSLSFEEFWSRIAEPDKYLGKVKEFLDIYGRKWI